MFEKPQSTHVLGLDKDAFSLKGIVLSQLRGKLKLDDSFDYLIESQEDEEGNVKPLYIASQHEKLKALADHNLVVTSAKTSEVLVRPLELKLKKDKDIEATLNFQVEPLLPYPVENAITDKVLISKDKEGSKLTVFCIRKDHLTQHMDQWNDLDINPEVVTAEPQALVVFSNQFIASEGPFFTVHLSLENSFGVLVDQGKLLAAQAIPAGLLHMIQILAQEQNKDIFSVYEELGNLSFQPDSPDITPAIKTALAEVRMAITRTIFSLAKQFKGKEVNHLIFTGLGATLKGLPETLCSQLKKGLLTTQNATGFNASQNELLNFALPIGQALSALPNCKDQVNFRQQEFLYPEPWKRLKQPILNYILLCLGIAASLFLFGKAYVAHQEGALRQQYTQVLNVMNKPYSAFENEFLKKTQGSSNPEIIDIADLSLEEIQSRLNYLENEIQSTPQTFPLLPNTPLVSDVLAWISSHPNFISKLQEGSKDAASMRIQSFSYNMVKRPEPSKKQEKYQIKVEMEFSSPTPKMAREFHDALIAPNDMIDPKGEIKWNSNRDLYRTSFYLKDRTIYPTT